MTEPFEAKNFVFETLDLIDTYVRDGRLSRESVLELLKEVSSVVEMDME